MKHIITMYKPLGQTPLQAIEAFKKNNPVYENTKLSYAGRLDPMAEGLLLVLVGEENKKRKQYEDLQKTYVFEVLFGVSTDTYDILGKLEKINVASVSENIMTAIKPLLLTYIGLHTQPYPPYSSKPVNGKPLYYWAREKRLSEIIIPTKEVEIYSLEYIKENSITAKTLQTKIRNRIAKVTGNFRQKEILDRWDNFFKKNPNQEFTLVKLQATCSSGTYVRSIANDLGKKLGTGAIAFSITRTAVGKYTLENTCSVPSPFRRGLG